MLTFYVDITDTYAGEANFSWVTRHRVTAASMMGAVRKLSRASGIRWRKQWDDGLFARYDSRSGATCALIRAWDDDMHGSLRLDSDI